MKTVMNFFRTINYGCIFYNKFHRSSANYLAFAVRNLRITPSVSFSLFYNSKESLGTNELTLIPFSSLIFSSRGLKVRASLQLRCKDCYFVRKDGVMYVECSSYPRHKQRAMEKRAKYNWILTYAFQSKIRPY